MDLRQLECFVAVAEEASFTRAAERLHLAQPGVSAQVRRLEAELGEPLLERTTRSVRLTGVGEAVLPHARQALAEAAAVRDAVAAESGLLRGRAVLGTIPSSGVRALPSLLAAFHTAHPGVELRLREGRSDELVRAVEEGELDAAIAGLAAPVPDRLASQPVLADRLVGAVARDHPLARRRTVTPAELAAGPLVCLPRGSGMRTALDAALDRVGLRAAVALEAGDPLVVADLAARGLGIAVLPAGLVRSRAGDLHALTIRGPAIGGRVELVWRTAGARRPAGRALADHLRTALAPDAPADAEAGADAEPAV